MKKLLFFLTILLLVAIPLCNAETSYTVGYAAVGGTSNAGASAVFNAATIIVPEGYVAHLTAITAYLSNDTAGVNCQLGVYNSYSALVEASESFLVNGEQWYTKALDSSVLNGTVWLTIVFTAEGAYRYYDSIASYDADFQGGCYPLPPGVTKSDWGAYAISIYLTYHFDALIDTTTKADLTWVLLFILCLNIALVLVRRPILNIVVGLITIAIAALSFQTGYTVIFQGWLQTMLFFVTISCMLISFKVSR